MSSSTWGWTSIHPPTILFHPHFMDEETKIQTWSHWLLTPLLVPEGTFKCRFLSPKSQCSSYYNLIPFGKNTTWTLVVRGCDFGFWLSYWASLLISSGLHFLIQNFGSWTKWTVSHVLKYYPKRSCLVLLLTGKKNRCSESPWRLNNHNFFLI